MKTKKCHMSSYLSSHLLSKPSLVICLLNENHMKTNNQCLSSSTCNLEAKPSFNAETRGSSNVILIDYLKGCSDLVTTRVSPWHAHTHKHTKYHVFFCRHQSNVYVEECVLVNKHIFTLAMCQCKLNIWITEVYFTVIDGNITYLFWALYSLHTGTGEEEKWIILCIIFSLKAHSLESTRKKYLQWNGMIFPVHFFPF